MKLRISAPWLIVLLALTAVATFLAINLFSSAEKKITHSFPHEHDVSHPQFIRTMGVMLGPSLVDGNRADTLLNGDEIFPAMLAAIRGAKKTITFETYIYWSGTVGKEFADAVAERAGKGVKVHILLDWVGSQKMDSSLLEEMRRAGVQIEKYHPLAWYNLNKLNNRTHRKLLVVDGRIGFTGGVGIADNWSGHAQDPDHWRDTHFRVEGPVVSQMQAAFTDNWTKVSGVVLVGEDYFPPLKPAGALLGQVFRSSPEGGSESMHLMYLLSIASAKSSIDLAMAYFVPDDLTRDALLAALKRGVKVRIIMPGGRTDAALVRRASRGMWGPIIQAGAELYEYQPTMYHCKVLVVDRLWTSVGSTNFDTRSFRLNDEANLNIHDREFALRQLTDFEADLGKSRRVTYEEWSNRPWTEKLWEHFIGLFSTQL